MQPSPSVSVIIPNYNHALYLKQRIESVLNQTHQDFELIILDDCSTDHSKTIIESYRNHPKVSHVLYNQQNSGSVFKQWIKGIELCQGDYVWIAESDDYASEDFLEKMHRFLNQDSNFGMSFCIATEVDSLGNQYSSLYESRKEIFEKLKAFGNAISRENAVLFLVADMIIQNASSVLFRTSELLKVDFEQLSTFWNTGDRFSYIGIALHSKIKFIPDPLCFMRLHEHNTTKKNTENGRIHQDRLRVLNYYFNHFLDTAYPKELAHFYQENYFHFMNFCTYQENVELLNNIYKTKAISPIFYYLVKNYMFMFLNKKWNVKGVRGLYYRILLLFN